MAQRDTKIGDLLAKSNLTGRWELGASMAQHTTFRAGGPADALVFPASENDVAAIIALARDNQLPLTVVGRGANLLVSDNGIRGITLAMSSLTGWTHNDGLLSVLAGTDVSEAARAGRDHGFSCLEFLNTMPSTVGGAVWMNARCYGAEIADVVASVSVIHRDGTRSEVPFEATQWSYKRSPFQDGQTLITRAVFRTRPATGSDVEAVMHANEADRTEKGHFRAPCAGSVFKNNHDFGAPSGVLIDRCGLKGRRRGRAVVSDWHANIIINEGGATAHDIRALIGEVKQAVFDQTGFGLEEEVIYTGDW